MIEMRSGVGDDKLINCSKTKNNTIEFNKKKFVNLSCLKALYILFIECSTNIE
ncbi:hypothetical protein KHM09_25410 [Leptospira borgpetersenii]|nr:hypothetical protein KHM09_25410 [Leptospira borgpetersenii]